MRVVFKLDANIPAITYVNGRNDATFVTVNSRTRVDIAVSESGNFLFYTDVMVARASLVPPG